MEGSNLVGSPCPICQRERTYKTNQGMKKGEGKPCRSCANSISQGGTGWSLLCFDCKTNPREDKYGSLCKDCHNARSKRYHTEVYRWAKYGLDGPIPMEACEICGDTENLVIDHCHDTNKFRGVLCLTCNMGIGHLKENKDVIKKALAYAERTFYE